MKKLIPIVVLATAALSACGSSPSQITGNGRVSIGVDVADGGSTETATKTVVAATDTSPAQVAWAVTPGKGVTFTFMTAPGSDAAYITGYQIIKQTTTTVKGTTTETSFPVVNKSNLYITSGFSCAARSALHSCTNADTAMVPDNGLPAQMNIYLEGGLGSLAQATNAGVSQVTDMKFIGKSSNGQDVSFVVDNIVSQGIRAGVD